MSRTPHYCLAVRVFRSVFRFSVFGFRFFGFSVFRFSDSCDFFTKTFQLLKKSSLIARSTPTGGHGESTDHQGRTRQTPGPETADVLDRHPIEIFRSEHVLTFGFRFFGFSVFRFFGFSVFNFHFTYFCDFFTKTFQLLKKSSRNDRSTPTGGHGTAPSRPRRTRQTRRPPTVTALLTHFDDQ